ATRGRKPQAIAAGACVLAILAGARAEAIEVKLLGQPLRIDITESLFAAYHGDLGGLVIEHDAPPPGSPLGTLGTAHPESHFYYVLNRLNLDLAWKRFRFATRWDTGVYLDTPAGSCGSPLTTPLTRRSNSRGATHSRHSA